jgi:hypothetical protein
MAHTEHLVLLILRLQQVRTLLLQAAIQLTLRS